jgi:hypothetical protein
MRGLGECGRTRRDEMTYDPREPVEIPAWLRVVA